MQRTFSLGEKIDKMEKTITRVLLGLSTLTLLSTIDLIVRGTWDRHWVSLVLTVGGFIAILYTIGNEEK